MKSSPELLLGHAQRVIDSWPHKVPFDPKAGTLIISWLEALQNRIALARNQGSMVCDSCFDLTPIDTSGTCRGCRREEARSDYIGGTTDV